MSTDADTNPQMTVDHGAARGYRGEAAEFQTSRAVTFEATNKQHCIAAR
jgi:hypothetical protein